MRKHPLWRFSVLALLTLAAGSCGDDDHMRFATPQSGSATLTSAIVMEPGPFNVGATTMTFVDTSRSTMANRGQPALPSRTLVTEIWYPTMATPPAGTKEARDAPVAANGGPYPLVIYSHGFMSVRTGGAYLARHLATHGYVVAAPDFPLSNGTTPGGANFFDVINQPGDVSFLITQLLALSTDPTSSLSGAIDAQRIGATGLSLGGETTYLVAFDPVMRDARIRAAAPMAGPACSYNSSFFNHALPLLIVHGDVDAIVPYQQNGVHAFLEAQPPKYLVTLAFGTHTGFADGMEMFDSRNNVDDIGCVALRMPPSVGGTSECPLPCSDPTPRPAAMKPSRQHQLTILSVFSFFEAYLRGNSSDRVFLEHTLAAENADVTVQF